MSDVTRPPGGAPAERGQNAPDARGETALGTSPVTAAESRTGPRDTRGGDASAPHTGGTAGTRLLPQEECDKLGLRLQHAVSGFVDGPRDAVEEADHVLEELASRFTDAVTQRRRTLRMSWQSADAGGGKSVTGADTEQLRLALRDYRELADRLLHI
ncbi:hypothetical protein [Streptomyces sp. S.PNR 29]|uniref:hypothetical protein n=1 Tax=Streptomyces sp. S.PNR 29 TaxID=2973805 RepID=UPI0025B1FF71|nr:hypothetical protein [Streptomyces sp. S.PNR 29]MDN0194519.1 hypothetical protein [Streptomyces sp. S.PNR 29]